MTAGPSRGPAAGQVPVRVVVYHPRVMAPENRQQRSSTDGAAFQATWQRFGEEWLLRLTPLNPGRKLPGRGETLTVDVTRKDGSEQRIPVRVEDWLNNAAGKPYAALARPDRASGKSRKTAGGGRRRQAAPAMPTSRPSRNDKRFR